MESNPDATQTASDSPTEPALSRTPLGETKIPDPTMMPTMIEQPSKSPNSRLSFVDSIFSLLSRPPGSLSSRPKSAGVNIGVVLLAGEAGEVDSCPVIVFVSPRQSCLWIGALVHWFTKYPSVQSFSTLSLSALDTSCRCNVLQYARKTCCSVAIFYILWWRSPLSLL